MIHHGENLKRLLKERDITQKQFADKMGLSRIYFHSLLNKKKLSKLYLDKIKKHLGTDLNYETEFYGNAVSESQEEYKFRGNITYVPIHAQGGFLIGYESKVYVDQLTHFFIPGVIGEHYAIEISGMSMYKGDDERSAKSGDLAICKPIESLNSFTRERGYILQTVDGMAYKIFDRIVGDEAHFSSLNPEHDGCKIDLKKIKRAYFVDFIMKKPY